MKKLSLILTSLMLSFVLCAQWDTSTPGQITYTGGTVGIGVSDLQSTFTVMSSGTMSTKFNPDAAYFQITDGSISMLMDGNEISTNEQLVFGTSYDHDFTFQNVSPTANSELLRIKANGFIGIGSNNPSEKLTLIDGQVFLGNNTVNKFESGRIRFSEWTNSFQGAFIHYDGGNNIFNIGVHQHNDTDPNGDNNAISIKRHTGYVGIGTTNPSQKLEVNGTVYSREVKVDIQAGTGPDYVFEEDYDLTSLEELEAYIQSEKHLPEVPSATEMQANGVRLGEMNMLLLKKVEELTLYIIDQEKRIQELEKNQK